MALAVLLAAVAAGALISQRGVGEAGADERPNFVVVTADDQSMHTFTRRAMPRTFAHVVDEGTEFTSSVAAPPLCCPDRAGFLTGQYPHNHGLEDNRPGYGELDDSHSVLPAWLDRAGYRTGFVGKYLNGTTTSLGRRQPAPGWDFWYATDDRVTYFGPTVWRGDEERTLLPHRYLTTQLNRQAVRFTRRSAGAQPFFLWLAEFAPHPRRHGDGYCDEDSPPPLPRDLARARNSRFPRGPSFNERNVSDKPWHVRRLRRMPPSARHAVERRYRCARASLQAVDRGVEGVVRALDSAGELENTVFVYTSDNGEMFGEHRLHEGKGQPYEEVLTVPLAIRVGEDVLEGDAPAATFDGPVAQIDLAPTFLELAAAEPCRHEDCRRLDGRSLTEVLGGKRPRWADSRGILVERVHDGLDRHGERTAGNCVYLALRTSEHKLIRTRRPNRGRGCLRGFAELYDLGADPHELHNRAGDPDYASVGAELDGRLRALLGCSGIADRDPPPPGRDYCE